MAARRLIINADDFGLTGGVNRAIAEAHSRGVVTSATLMATGAAFDDAIARAKEKPRLSVGCHVLLVDGTPASRAAALRSLVNGDQFQNSLARFAHAALRGVDIAAALEAPGVVAVWTGAEIADLPPIDFRDPAAEALRPYRQPLLAQQWLRYVGEPVAVVFATDAYLSEDAAELVTIDADELMPVLAADAPPGSFAPGQFTEALVLRVQSHRPGELWPAQLYAHTTFWRSEKKTKKRPLFAIWVNQTLRWIRGRYPATSVPFMRIGTDALGKARAGTLRLTYLYRTIAPEPEAQTSSVK